MTTWFHPLGRAALSMAMAATLAACGGDGNGGGAVRVFFGANGSGGCDEVVIEVNLEEIDGVLSVDDEGALQCALDELLADDGCDVDFDLAEDGENLTVTITGCEVPAVASLFECFFDDVDTSEIQAATSSSQSASARTATPAPARSATTRTTTTATATWTARTPTAATPPSARRRPRPPRSRPRRPRS